MHKQLSQKKESKYLPLALPMPLKPALLKSSLALKSVQKLTLPEVSHMSLMRCPRLCSMIPPADMSLLCPVVAWRSVGGNSELNGGHKRSTLPEGSASSNSSEEVFYSTEQQFVAQAEGG